MKKETPVISVKTDGKGPNLGDFYGLFFEDINHAADGGLYAQMVQNPSFEFDGIDNREYRHDTAWETFGGAELTCKDRGGLFEKNPWWGQVSADAEDGGVLTPASADFTLRRGRATPSVFSPRGP